MVFITVNDGTHCVAEICGNVEVVNKQLSISVRQEEMFKALKLASTLDETTVINGKLVFPTYRVKYMSNRHDFTQECIRLIDPKPVDAEDLEEQEENYENP